MNLALAWTWKEWRAQRALLAAYLAMTLVAYALMLLLLPVDKWWGNGNRAALLGWAFTIGVVGLLAFAAPMLARSELGSKDDQFVRRLPGALPSAFAGKALFLLLATAALPLATLAIGQLLFAALGRDWQDLWVVAKYPPEAVLDWPLTFTGSALALLLAPWVAAFAWWLPGARMAVGATVLFALLLAVAVFFTLTACPGLTVTLRLLATWWLPYVPVLGATVAWVAFVRGRRGGDHRRSAKLGALALCAGLVPPAGWLANWAFDYHHPDLRTVEVLQVEGLTPDHRFALARATSHGDWIPVPVRIDLQTGDWTQLGGITDWTCPDLLRMQAWRDAVPAQRSWLCRNDDTVLDLVTLTKRSLPRASLLRELPDDLRAEHVATARATTALLGPDGRRAWSDGSTLHVESANGEQTFAWPSATNGWLRPFGHAIQALLNGKSEWFDLARLQPVAVPADLTVQVVVGGTWLARGTMPGLGGWYRFDPATGAHEACDELKNCEVICLLDDARLLVRRQVGRKQMGELFAYVVATRELTAVALPADFVRPGTTNWWLGSSSQRGTRDAGGRLWLQAASNTKAAAQHGFLVLDPHTLGCESRLFGPPSWRSQRTWQLLAFDGNDSALALAEQSRLVRLDLTSGRETVLFPRAEGER